MTQNSDRPKQRVVLGRRAIELIDALLPEGITVTSEALEDALARQSERLHSAEHESAIAADLLGKIGGEFGTLKSDVQAFAKFSMMALHQMQEEARSTRQVLCVVAASLAKNGQNEAQNLVKQILPEIERMADTTRELRTREGLQPEPFDRSAIEAFINQLGRPDCAHEIAAKGKDREMER